LLPQANGNWDIPQPAGSGANNIALIWKVQEGEQRLLSTDEAFVFIWLIEIEQIIV